MHVGILSEHSDPARGGAERYLAALAERLRSDGHRVTVCARTGPHARPVRSTPASMRPRYYEDAFLPYLRDAGAEIVLTTVPVPGCDAYQPHHGLFGASVPAHLDPLPWGVRQVRRYNPWRVLHFAHLRKLEARVVAEARVLALSPRVVKDVERFYPGVKTTLLRPGVDLRRFSPGNGRGEQPLLLFVGHNFRLKGLRTLLRALKRIPDARAIVVGRDKPLGGERVEYLREVEDLAALYRRAHVLVHPTWYDTAASVVLEAMACGTPAITTERDGNADLAREGGGAILGDPGDDAALARAIEEVLARRDGDRARAVAERYGEDETLDRVVGVLTCGC